MSREGALRSSLFIMEPEVLRNPPVQKMLSNILDVCLLLIPLIGRTFISLQGATFTKIWFLHRMLTRLQNQQFSGGQMFFAKDSTENVLALWAIQSLLQHYSVFCNNESSHGYHGYDCVPIKLYLYKQTVGQIGGQSLASPGLVQENEFLPCPAPPQPPHMQHTHVDSASKSYELYRSTEKILSLSKISFHSSFTS